jgi:hypothetical protein
MEVDDLASHRTADQNVGGGAQRPRDLENLVPLCVAPPAAANRLARDRLGKVRDRAAGAFENGAVAADEMQRESGVRL